MGPVDCYNGDIENLILYYEDGQGSRIICRSGVKGCCRTNI